MSVETIPIGMMNVSDLAIARGSDAGERPSPAPEGGRNSRPSGRPPAPRMTPIDPEVLRNAAKTAQSASDGESDVHAFLPAAGPSKALPIVGGLVLGLGILGGIAAYSRTRDPAPSVTAASAVPAPSTAIPATAIPAVSAAPAVTTAPDVPSAATGAPVTDATKGASPAPNPPANGKAPTTPKATATTAVTAAPPATAAPVPKPKGKDEDDPWK